MTALPRLRPLCAALLLSSVAGAASAADLMQAYELARQSDPQLQAADATRLANREGVPQARSNLLPQISGSASLNRSRDDSEGGTTILDNGSIVSGDTETETTSRSYDLTLNQSIYSRANYTRLNAARARAEQADATYDAANDALILRVAQAYFNTLTAIDALAFARAEERAVKRQLDQADQRFEVGLTAITDVHEARARYDSARANAIAQEVVLDDAREALTELTGQTLTNLQGLEENFAPAQPTPDNIAQWVETALAQNPTLLAQEFAVQAAEHDIATARAGHLPTLSGNLSVGKGANWGEREPFGKPIDPFSSAGTDRRIGITLTVPIFSGGLTQSQVRQSIYSRDASEDVLEQQRRAVTRETRNAFRSLLAGISEIEARRQALVSAQSALEATEAGFEVGTRTIVDVLISQQTLFQAQSGYSTSRHNFLVNTLALKQAAGIIEMKDVAEVNRHLVRNAEAALDLPPSEDGSVVTPDGSGEVKPVEPVDIAPVPQVED